MKHLAKEQFWRRRWFSRKSWFLILAAVLGLCLVATGCGSKTLGRGAGSSLPVDQITVAGSTSVQPLSEVLSEEFMAKNPGIKIDVQGGGSAAGIQAVRSGAAQIGASSRELKPEEKEGIKEFLIAYDGLAIVVNPANSVDSLTLDQVRKIYQGRITNWKEVGGIDKPINVITREAGSGTRGAFEELVMGKDNPISDRAIVQNSTGAVRSAVAADAQAIGYISLANLDNTVKAVKIEGVEATVTNINSGVYKLYRPFLYLTKGEPQGAVKAFLDFVLSPEGQTVVEKEGLVRVK